MLKTSRHYKAETALYIRVACEDNDAAQHQEDALRAYAENNGYKNLRPYIDNGVGGAALDRPELNRLSNDIADGYITAVIVRDLTRIGRNTIDSIGWINNARRKGVMFASVRDDFIDNGRMDKTVLFERYCKLLEISESPIIGAINKTT